MLLIVLVVLIIIARFMRHPKEYIVSMTTIPSRTNYTRLRNLWQNKPFHRNISLYTCQINTNVLMSR